MSLGVALCIFLSFEAVVCLLLRIAVSSRFRVALVAQLQDDDEYADIVEDIRIECEECGGRVVEVQVPRICQDPCLDPRHIHDPDDLPQNSGDDDSSSSASAVGVKREEAEGGSGREAEKVKSEQDAKAAVKDEKADKNVADEIVTQEMILEALEGKTKVMPPMVGYAYVAFIDCEASANARKVRWRLIIAKARRSVL